MIKLVLPKVFLVGYTSIDSDGLKSYLEHTDQEAFLNEIYEARNESKLSDGEILCSFYAKLCYASLVLGKNENVSKVRSIYKNIISTIESGHGSVFEHCYLNFVVTDCSRVFTHELVRHRVGTSFSQTSGRYVRTDQLRFVYDDILFPAKKRIIELLNHIEEEYKEIQKEMKIYEIKDFAQKKKITSAMRRILPNGQSNEIGFGVNLRSLRHTIEMRTSEHAEWEIRLVFNQIFNLVKDRFPSIVSDATMEMINGQNQITFKSKKL